MAFDAHEFRTLAEWLVANQPHEASLRTAISRIYYAAHLLARESLRTKHGWEPTGRGDDHSAVIRELRRGKTTSLGFNINELRRLREHADYHLESIDTIVNRDCRHCQNVRKSAPGAPVVDESHWQNVQELTRVVFPQLDRL